MFLKELKKLGLIVNEGKIINASFIEVPKQRNTKDKNNQIKKGETPKSFDEKPNKKSKKIPLRYGQRKIILIILDTKTI